MQRAFFIILLWPMLPAMGQSKAVQADILIRNCTMLDVANKQVLTNKNILILNGHIYSITDKTTFISAKKVIDGSHLLAMPGFINTHTHLWQHIGKSQYPKESLQEWIKVYRSIHYLEPEELYKVVLAASNEALLSGITTVSDYASLSFNDYAFEVNARAIKDAGLGGILVWNNPSVFLPDYIKKLEITRIQDKFKKDFSIWMGPGALSFYSIPQFYSGVLIARQLGMHITEHTMENMQEQRDFYDNTSGYLKNYGDQLRIPDKDMLQSLVQMKRPSQVDAYEELLRSRNRILYFDDLLKSDSLAKKLTDKEKEQIFSLPSNRIISQLPLLEYLGALDNYLAIHAVWLQDADIAIGKRHNISVSHNPESNLYLSSGVAPIYEYLNACIPVTLGTDGGASNDGINFFSAMRAMWNMYKIRLLNVDISKRIDEWEIICAATINGARALHIDNKTGSLDVGKEADITLLSTDDLGMSPLRPSHIIPLLVYSADTRNVKYVISDGKILVKDGQLNKMKENKLALDLSSIANSVDKKIKSGKIWNVNYSLTRENFKHYWYKFRSIRELDSVNIRFVNKTKEPVHFSVMSSAATFGGGTPVVVSKEVNERFPYKQVPGSFSETITLAAGDDVRIMKNKGKYIIRIVYSSSSIVKETKSGQLLLLAESE